MQVPEKFSAVLALIKSNTPIFEVTHLQNGGDGTFVSGYQMLFQMFFHSKNKSESFGHSVVSDSL